MTIRLLDPPLHEFLPEGEIDEIVSQLGSDTGMTEDEVLSRIEKLSEVNPMLGFRGCRFDTMLRTFIFWSWGIFLIVGQFIRRSGEINTCNSIHRWLISLSYGLA